MADNETSETLESIQARHRKEQRELVARITQKKKSATKKTRKGVNDECDRLEYLLNERQAQELASFGGAETDLAESIEELEISDGTSNGQVPVDEPDTAQNGPKKKPNRAKARLARRAAEQDALVAQAAEEAAALPDRREQERASMQDQFRKYNLQEKEIRADGHCLYAAVADQIESRGLGFKPRIQLKINQEDTSLPAYKKVRCAAADFIESDPDSFVPFMEEPLDTYTRKIRDTGTWGGHMELLALARTYGVKINVLHGDGQVDKIESEESSSEDDREIWLGYYRHGFGLGEHYNSLRKTP
ncbi:hypothetical protein B0J11DRAFT_548667 [Dendryphion nanum]|uniref:OTU domain-containing protein n=1 Tax=Dendryphion nanum TaxID=256645 RepID=A0A9P9E5F1_9PLEO|nr:hypothetical protein B0J11DRAFT_548667 [Dendryphion nanum]